MMPQASHSAGGPSEVPTRSPSPTTVYAITLSTLRPTSEPSDTPSEKPSDQPSSDPSGNPTDPPSGFPSDEPSDAPSNYPSDSQYQNSCLLLRMASTQMFFRLASEVLCRKFCMGVIFLCMDNSA
jgi:hypothetical protein